MADETPTTVEEVLPEGTATGTGFDTPTKLSEALTSRLATQADIIPNKIFLILSLIASLCLLRALFFTLSVRSQLVVGFNKHWFVSLTHSSAINCKPLYIYVAFCINLISSYRDTGCSIR